MPASQPPRPAESPVVPAEVRATIRHVHWYASCAGAALVTVAVAVRLAHGPRPVIAALVALAVVCGVYGARWGHRVATSATAGPGRAAVARVRGIGRGWSLVDVEGEACAVVCWGRPRTRGLDVEPVSVFGDLGGHFVITSTHQCWLPVLPSLPGVLRRLIPHRARSVLRVPAHASARTHQPDAVALHRLADSPGGEGSVATDPHLDQRREPSHRPDLRSFGH